MCEQSKVRIKTSSVFALEVLVVVAVAEVIATIEVKNSVNSIDAAAVLKHLFLDVVVKDAV